MVQATNLKWLALDIILYALHDYLGKNKELRMSAIVFFQGDPAESNYGLCLDVLEVNIDKGYPQPDEILEMLLQAGYKKPLDARPSKLHQLARE